MVRSMFTHGSRWDIIGSDVTACTRAAPASGSPTTSATRAHSWRAARNFAIVMNWSSSAAYRKLICRNASGTATPPSPSSRRYATAAATLPASSHDALAPRLWNAGPSTVIARTPPPYPVTFAAVATTSATLGAARPLSGAVNGSAPRSSDSRER